MASGHRWSTVGDDLLDLVMAEYRIGDTVHWPTAIAATACLAGESALMTHEARLPEYGVRESEKVAAFIHDGSVRSKTLWGYTTTVASQAYGVEEQALPEYRAIVLRLGMQLQAGSFPALDMPLYLMPHETPMNAGPRLRRQMHEVAQSHGTQGTDTAFALMTAAMKMVGAAQAIGARDMTALALQCCVAGARFVPLVYPVMTDAQYTTLPPARQDATPEPVPAPAPAPAPVKAAKPAPVEETMSMTDLVAAMLSDDSSVPVAR